MFQGDIVGHTNSLYIDFQEGFTSDSVKVIVNGILINKQKLFSDYVLGLAGVLDLPIDSLQTLEIMLSKRGKQYYIKVDSVKSNFLEVYYDPQKDELSYSFKRDPFSYE